MAQIVPFRHNRRRLSATVSVASTRSWTRALRLGNKLQILAHEQPEVLHVVEAYINHRLRRVPEPRKAPHSRSVTSPIA